MRILRTALLTGAGGMLMAVVVLGWNTAPHPKILGGPGTTITDEGGTNPWTGKSDR